MIPLEFHIAPNGEVTGVYTDAIPLQSLGPLKVERASMVEFNEATQEWEVRIPDKLCPAIAPAMFSHPSRAACIEWEIKEINYRISGAVEKS